jgi:hypothetical protein
MTADVGMTVANDDVGHIPLLAQRSTPPGFSHPANVGAPPASTQRARLLHRRANEPDPPFHSVNVAPSAAYCAAVSLKA